MGYPKKYTTELSKGQGMVAETLAILQLWEPSISLAELKTAAVQEGVIGRATTVRVKDIVGRVFGRRYLCDGGKPAQNLKQLMKQGVAGKNLLQLMFIHTARAHDILHDFITQTYWPKYATGAHMITRQDALDFLESAVSNGIIAPRWSDTMTVRSARNLTGCLSDFQLAGKDHAGRREMMPFSIQPLATLYLAHDIHFAGFSDNALIEHEDWQLFGLEPMDVRHVLERVSNGHFIAQYSGELIRISWKYRTMEEALSGIIAAGF